jgi:hypothetical protein
MEEPVPLSDHDVVHKFDPYEVAIISELADAYFIKREFIQK